MPTRRPSAAARAKRIDLALQGGGSHGAFTWGALDRLLDEEDLEFDGISGTSAGALNAAVLATGLVEGGRRGAQQALRAFWLDVASSGACFGHVGPGRGAWPWSSALPAWPPNPLASWLETFVRLVGPYPFNPLDINPLRDIVRRHVRIAALRASRVRLFVAATAVASGQQRIFRCADIGHQALLASACLPQLFRAVEIDGVAYWDGGYSGNPALWPLIYETASLDIVLVKINPLERAGLPDTAHEIADRVNEITFNAPLLGELRAIAFVARLIEQGRLDPGEYRHLRLHMVADEQGLGRYTPSSKLDTSRALLLELHGLGHAAASRWLAEHKAAIGRRATLDIADRFLERAAARPR